MKKSNEDILLILDMINNNPENILDCYIDFYPKFIRLFYECPKEKYKIKVSVLIEKKRKTLIEMLTKLFSKDKVGNEREARIFLQYEGCDSIPFKLSEDKDVDHIDKIMDSILEKFNIIKRRKEQEQYDYMIEIIKKGNE